MNLKGNIEGADGKIYRRSKVIMLPTQVGENFPILKNLKSIGSKVLYEPTKGYYYTQSYLKEQQFEAQHLYFITDEEIKEGDWVYNTYAKYVRQLHHKHNETSFDKKIIATTDISLNNREILVGDIVKEGDNAGLIIQLPQPSPAFIAKYIDKGEKIEDVLVEYEEFGRMKSSGEVCSIITQPKINAQDNTITIKKVKKNWSREELDLTLQRYGDYVCNSVLSSGKPLYKSSKEWMDQNL